MADEWINRAFGYESHNEGEPPPQDDEDITYYQGPSTSPGETLHQKGNDTDAPVDADPDADEGDTES